MAAGRTASITAGDLSDLVFTSGTTGQPKGAMTTHGQTLRTFATWAESWGCGEGDRYLIVNPFFHTFGYKAGILACLMPGPPWCPSRCSTSTGVLERIEAERITVLPGAPTIYQSILDQPDRDGVDLSTLRLAVTGRGHRPGGAGRAHVVELGVETVLTAYGLTEATGTVTMCRRGDAAETIARTSGRAIPEVEVRMVDDDGRRGRPGRGRARSWSAATT